MVTNRCFSGSVAVQSGLLFQRDEIYSVLAGKKHDALGIKTLWGLLHDIGMSFVQERVHPGCRIP